MKLGAGRVYIQGDDFKAAQWCKYFNMPVLNNVTWKHFLSMLIFSWRNDVIIFRYQNNPSSLAPAIVEALLVLLNVLKAKLCGIRTVWICHNVDQDTQPNFKAIEKFRRAILMTFADFVLVLDSAFLKYVPRGDVLVVSFGEKNDGYTSATSVAMVSGLADKVNVVILIASQDGGKYKAFIRIPEIYQKFLGLGIKAGFVTAGMLESRHFSREIEDVLVRLPERNLRESDLAPFLNYIYRENSDISMPFTVYAAATAGIPILTSRDNILAEIVKREDIGVWLEDDIDINYSDFNFTRFLERHQWTSLAEVLRSAGVSV